MTRLSVVRERPEVRSVQGNAPLRLVGAGVWRILEGEVDLFAVASDGPGGRRHHVGQIGQGGLLFELPPAGPLELIAVGLVGTRARSVRLDDIEHDDNGLEAWLAAVDGEPATGDPVSAARAAGTRQLGQAEASVEKARATRQARLQTRRDVDRGLLDRALRGLGTLREGRGVAVHAPEDALGRALLAITEALGLALPPTAFDDLGDGAVFRQLERFGRRTRTRARRVLLRGDWFSADAGPLLAFEARDDAPPHPVALLPGPRGYRVSNQAGVSEPVTEAVAGRLTGEAFQIYAGFRADRVRPLDLVRFALRGRERDLALVAIIGLAGSLVASGVPIATLQVFGNVIPNADRPLLGFVLAALFGLAIGRGAFQLTLGLAQLRLETQATATSQAAIWDRVLSLPMKFFRDYGTGDLMQRAMGIERIRATLSGSVLSAVMSAVFSLSSFFLLFYFSAKLALAALGLLAVAGLVALIGGAIEIGYQRRIAQMSGKTSSFLLENIAGVAKLRSAGAETRAFEQWTRLFGAHWTETYRSARVMHRVSTFTVTYPLVTSIVLFSVMGTLGGDIGTADFIAFSAAFSTFNSATLGLIRAGIGALSILPAYERAKPILETVPEVRAEAAEDVTLEGRIDFSRVSFRYGEEGRNVLEDVSFSVPTGKMVAIVGPSGSGKSTLVRLLLGFEAPTSGAVYYDDRDLAELDKEAVRRALGVVTQDGRVLAGTMLENIQGASDATLEQAWAAAEKSALAHDIRGLPMGMHTLLHPGGGTLSGGQRQRLMIARALVTEPKILVLDEATSALDNRTQAVVTDSLEALGVTRIVIAHRLSTIEKADHIIHLERGRVTEQGTFEELVAAGGAFAKLAERQRA